MSFEMTHKIISINLYFGLKSTPTTSDKKTIKT